MAFYDKPDHNIYNASADEIMPGIWVGNEAASQSARFMEMANIGLIINATTHIVSKFLGSIYYMRVPVNDAAEENDKMHVCMGVAVRAIARARAVGMGVLIHCHAGMQRSAAICAAYILYARPDLAITPADACLRICEARPLAFNYGKNVNFAAALNKFMLLMRG
jgi:predicted protein tyrosine phosphatase